MSSPNQITTNLNGANICFTDSDSAWINDPSILSIAHKIVELMYQERVLRKFLLEVIFECHMNETANSYSIIEKKIKMQIAFYPMHSDKLLIFKSQYLQLFSPDKILQLKDSDKDAYIIWVNKIRGTILELILERTVHKKFNAHMIGCYVSVNGKKISYEGKQSVDLAGIKKECFFYECKVTPEGFDHNDGPNQLNLLLKIKDEMGNNLVQSNLYCVSAGPKALIEDKLKYIRPDRYLEFNSIGATELIS